MINSGGFFSATVDPNHIYHYNGYYGTLLVDNYIMCEVLFRDANGTWPKMPPIEQLQEFLGFSVGYFDEEGSRAGTGFVIKNLLYHPDYCSIVLTVAHIFIEDFQFKCSQKYFKIGNETYVAFPLKQTLDLNNISQFFRDPISGVRISMPEDWLLCG